MTHKFDEEFTESDIIKMDLNRTTKIFDKKDYKVN